MKQEFYLERPIHLLNITHNLTNTPLCIEMHRSMWSEEFTKYRCKDLAAGGILFENPDVLQQTSNYIKECIRNGRYIITPIRWDYYYKRRSVVSGYIYVFDSSEGMKIGFDSNEVRH